MREQIIRDYRNSVMIRQAYRALHEGVEPPEPMHLWIEKDKVAELPNGRVIPEQVELRPGNAPPDSDRPRHLRGKDLWIDCRGLPRTVLEVLMCGGTVDKLKERYPKVNVEEILDFVDVDKAISLDEQNNMDILFKDKIIT